MYEIIELTYSREELQTYINKKGHTFLGFSEGLMIFKVKKETKTEIKTSTAIVAKETIEDIIKKEFTIDFIKEVYEQYNLSKEDFQEVCVTFVGYWKAEIKKGRNKGQELWTDEKTFDSKLRFRTFMRMNKRRSKQTPKKSATITTFG